MLQGKPIQANVPLLLALCSEHVTPSLYLTMRAGSSSMSSFEDAASNGQIQPADPSGMATQCVVLLQMAENSLTLLPYKGRVCVSCSLNLVGSVAALPRRSDIMELEAGSLCLVLQ